MPRKNQFFLSILIVVCLLLIGSQSILAETSASEDVEANEMGRIPVLEYHKVSDYEARWTREIENFKNDLLFLYNNDYYPITTKDFISGNIDVPAGKKPVVITFDDGSQGQFNILESGDVDPNSAVALMDAFCKKHTDFNCTAIFYVNGTPFKQKEHIKRKLNYLVDNGYEVGNHTLTHADLAKSGRVSYELGAVNNRLLDWIDSDVEIDSLAYPFGAYPKNEAAFSTIREGEYEGTTYKITNAYLVGAEPAFSPYNKNFNPYKIPRIQAIDDEWIRHFNRAPGVTGRVTERFKPFVSDGVAGKITVSKENERLVAEKFADRIGKEVALETPSPKPTPSPEATAVASPSPSPTSEPESTPNPDTYFSKGSASSSPIRLDVAKIVEQPAATYGNVMRYLRPIVKNVSFHSPPEDLELRGRRFYYKAKEGEDYEAIAGKYLNKSAFYSAVTFAEEMKRVNKEKEIKSGDDVIVPGIRLVDLPSTFEVKNPRGVYLTAYSVKASGKKFVDTLVKNGGNMVVFDVKAGRISYESDLEIVKTMNDQSRHSYNLEEWIDYLHANNVYAVGRVVAFKDGHVAASRRDWNLQRRGGGGYWSNHEGAIWLDPSHPEVQDYLLQITEELAQKGIDEVQYDYVRFPATGTAKTISFKGQERGLDREDAIIEFLEKAKEVVEPYGTKISVDVFGVAGWSRLDASIVGQDIERMAKTVDVIYPMIYPSHFGPGYNGHPDPANDPYYFVQESTKKFLKLAGEDGAEIRPWFQGFPLRVNNFGVWYMEAQKKALNDIGMDSFVVWSPGNKYWATWPIVYSFE